MRSPPKRAFAACLAHWSWSPPFAMATDPRDATRRHRARSYDYPAGDASVRPAWTNNKVEKILPLMKARNLKLFPR